jgi:anthranilate phosphoribosyltransferase
MRKVSRKPMGMAAIGSNSPGSWGGGSHYAGHGHKSIFSDSSYGLNNEFVIGKLTQVVSSGRELTFEEVSLAVLELIQEELPAEPKADFLAALAGRGETIGEIASFARAMQNMSVKPPVDPAMGNEDIMDVCGTGGDRLNTFNISTIVALIAAAGGIAVAKHGNRAVTSKSGSADMLEALGIRTELSPEEAAHWLREHRFAFFFAPRYHPAFKGIAPARKLCAQRGQRTVFNILGPLLNPARPTCQIVGVSSPQWCEPLARVLQELGLRRAMVVCGEAGAGFMDEISPFGKNTMAEFYQERGFNLTTNRFEHLCSQPVTIGDLIGGDRGLNADIARGILEGQDRGPKREIVLLNAGAALFVAGKARSISEGWTLAADLIDTGRATAKLDELIGASQASVVAESKPGPAS